MLTCAWKWLINKPQLVTHYTVDIVHYCHLFRQATKRDVAPEASTCGSHFRVFVDYRCVSEFTLAYSQNGTVYLLNKTVSFREGGANENKAN